VSITWCDDCGGMSFGTAVHTCPPRWDIWRPDHGEERGDRHPERGEDAEAAVTLWAERDDSDSAEYSIVGGEEATVHVCPHDADGDAQHEVWRVYGEAQPVYHAAQVEP
jgi:hypothetical protein